MADKSLKFDIIADPDKALDALQEVAKATDKLEGETVTFKTEADTDQAIASVKALRDHLEALSKVRPDLDVSGAVAGLDRLEAKARAAGANIRNATDNLGKGAIQSVGPLRDVSAAFGNVGVGALDAAEGVLGFSESLALANPKFEKFFAIASRSAFIGGALAAGVIAASKALADFTGASTATADALKTLAIADETTETMKAFAKALGSSAIQNGLRVIGSGGKDIEEFNDVLKASPAAALNLIRVLEETGENVEQLTGQYDDYVKATALTGKETQKFAEDVALAQKAMEAGIDITDMSTEAIVRLMGQQDLQIAQQAGLNEAIAAGNEQMAEMARVTREEAAAATEELVSSIDDLNAALGEMSGAILSEAENRVALADAQAAYNEQVKEGKSSTDELVVAAQDIAGAYADVLEAQKLANGESFTTEDRNDAIRASLKATADQAKGPTKDAINQVVAALDEVPSEVNTDVNVNTGNALSLLNEIIRKMQIIRDTSPATVAALRGVSGGAGGAILGQSVGGITQNITVNAGFGTDAFAVRSAVLNSARQAARLTQNAVRFAS